MRMLVVLFAICATANKPARKDSTLPRIDLRPARFISYTLHYKRLINEVNETDKRTSKRPTNNTRTFKRLQ